MALTALLWSAEEQTVQVLRSILQEMGVVVEACSAREAAEARLAEKRYDAVIVDFEGQSENAAAVLRKARRTSLNHNTLAITVASSGVNVREIFALGSNFVLYKPISEERAKTSLRAARSLMGRERRRSVRLPVHARATLDYSSQENVQATLLDLSEEGTAVQLERQLPPACKIYFKFSLPGQTSAVRLSAEVVWQDSTGRVGLRFMDVPQGSRRVMQDWLGDAFAEGKAAKSLEEAPAPSGSLSARSMVSTSAGDVKAETHSKGVGAGNRRNQARKPCQLGAEVFKGGTAVPHRCTITDIGPGGCYVEMPTPFTAQTPVEVQIRTRESKVRLPGLVQAVHPGFGMGVRFKPLSPSQQEDLLALLRDLGKSAQGLEMGSMPWLK